MCDWGKRRRTRYAGFSGGMGAVAPMANRCCPREGQAGPDQHPPEWTHHSLIGGISQRVVDDKPSGHVTCNLQITGWRPGHKSLCRQIEVLVSANLREANLSPTSSPNAFANPSVIGGSLRHSQASSTVRSSHVRFKFSRPRARPRCRGRGPACGGRRRCAALAPCSNHGEKESSRASFRA
jgi:hypothetical protein